MHVTTHAPPLFPGHGTVRATLSHAVTGMNGTVVRIVATTDVAGKVKPAIDRIAQFVREQSRSH